MRLIDADAMNEELFYEQAGGKDTLITCETAFDMIKAQPTAYDVDNVANAVVEITERILNNCDEIELDCPEEERTGYDMHDDIMQIRHLVKYGGIGTDDACEWRLKDDYQWHTGCRNKIDNMDNEVNTIEDYIEHTRFSYCPFCRKKIKVADLYEDD